MDSVGTGALPDAAEWGDAGSHTFDHVVAAENPRLPVLQRFGMGYIAGVAARLEAHDNAETMDQTVHELESYPSGLIFSNLGDFDMLWGHRRDSGGYAKGLEYLDSRIGDLLRVMQPEDILVLTADHGCDPTYRGSDHTREYVPLLVYGKSLKGGIDLGTRSTLADIGQTIADNFRLRIAAGESFLGVLR